MIIIFGTAKTNTTKINSEFGRVVSATRHRLSSSSNRSGCLPLPVGGSQSASAATRWNAARGMNLPDTLSKALDAEDGEITTLQGSIWSEGRAGADLLVEAPSSPETTIGFAILLLEQVLEALASAEARKPRRYFRAGSLGGGNGNAKDKKKHAPLCALVLTRNRDIAASVSDALTRLGKGIPSLQVCTLIGGVPVAENVKTLEKGCHIAVGTPGRVKFLMDKGVLTPGSARTLVLESADWLIAPVFLEDVGYIVGKFPEEKQVLAFSTADTASMEEGLCALLGVPVLKRLDASGAVQQTRVRFPDPVPQTGEDSVVDGQSDRGGEQSSQRMPAEERVAVEAGMDTTAATPLKQLPIHGRPGQQAFVAVASAKEKLLQETRKALNASTARMTTATGGGDTSGKGGRHRRVSSTSLSPPSHSSPSARWGGKSTAGTASAAAAAMRYRNSRIKVAPAADEGFGGVSSNSASPHPPPSYSDATRRSLERRHSSVDLDRGRCGGRSGSPRGRSPVASGGIGGGGGAQPASRPLSQNNLTAVSSGMFSRAANAQAHAAAMTMSSALGRNARGGGDGVIPGGIMSRAGAHDDDCASTLDAQTLGLLSPGALKEGAVVAAAAAAGAVHQGATQSGEVETVERTRDLAGLKVQTTTAAAAVMMAGCTAVVTTATTTAETVATTVSDGDRLGASGWGLDEQLRQRQMQQIGAIKASSSTASLHLDEWDIPAPLMVSLEADGVTAPTPLQASVWTAGRGRNQPDLLVHGRPGKETATSYCLPILERIYERYPFAPESLEEEESMELQALVLTRTRDMAANVAETLQRLGEGIPSLAVVTLVGGVPVAENSRVLAGGCNVAVGTPGRVRFLMTKGLLRTYSAVTLVLDSADWLMAPVFQEDVGWIAGRFPKEKQVFAFSGADPVAIEDGLKALVSSDRMKCIGGNGSGSGSTAVTLEQGEAAAAAIAASAAAAAVGSMPTSSARAPSPSNDRNAPRGLGDPYLEGMRQTVDVGRRAVVSGNGGLGSPSMAMAMAAMPPVSQATGSQFPAAETHPSAPRVGFAPSNDGSVSPIRTLGMIRADSARRAQRVGMYSVGTGYGVMGPAMVDGMAVGPGGVGAGTAPPNYFTKGHGGSAGGGGGVGSGVKGSVASTSSTASVSSTSSSLRARARSSRENELYAAWCAPL